METWMSKSPNKREKSLKRKFMSKYIRVPPQQSLAKS